ncbi:DNA polymerase epsilon catalytic subunit [Podochytrium sp. JEL0797]|nr:DNA polymerase epsilon catalytic subunit [Podochytrium sp. JEL0797]
MQRKWGAESGGGNRFGNKGNTTANSSDAIANKDRDEFDASADAQLKFEVVRRMDAQDARMGFERYTEGGVRLGWMVNMVPTLALHNECATGHAAVDCYFLEEDGKTFKITLLYEPYLFLVCKPGTESDVEDYLRRSFEGHIAHISRHTKEDLTLANHLSGKVRTVVKVSFYNMQNLLHVRSKLFPIVTRNKAKLNAETTYEDINELTNQNEGARRAPKKANLRESVEYIIDMREHDVMYYVRAAIDCDLRVGLWYDVKASGLGKISIEERKDKVKRAEPVVLAFDIETTKLPLKFPDAAIDSIMMISYMIDGQGFLITNRTIVSLDIEDFDYTPKPEYEGPFTIFNEEDECSLLKRFFEHIRDAKPTIFVTYNGDFFDWPFVEARAATYGMSLEREIGFAKDSQDEYKSSYAIHMDAFCWVKRDSYLPQGSQGLKAVTTYKLGYNPMELDPEDMTRFASEQPQTLAQYSVSDAVATYYLYMKYVHPFIFSLCNIIPMSPDDVLRRGSGTLCETLLMVEAFKANVLMPNKHQEQTGKMFEGHLLESETYVGGHVEALEAGVFRSDLETQFRVVPAAYQQLIDEIDQALEFSITVECKLKMEDVMNYDEIREEIIANLSELRDEPNKMRLPLIYHLDVAAMYPNIILTNRLQPDAIVTENDCAACDFNEGPDSTCQRRMVWSWRGEYYPAKRSEYNMIRNQLEKEMFPNPFPGAPAKAFHDLRVPEQNAHIKKRVEDYSKKIYAKKFEHKVIEKESIVCQRENPFYVDTVKSFRDRRYTYKGLLKTWKKKVDDAAADGDLAAVDEAKKMTVVYDSLQLAHKCILNSFYGYVMRKGARWYSMEMAGIVCLTGSTIIQLARSRVEKLGRPLELDTDGIWLILPKAFPENFVFKLKNGKSAYMSYPCVMLNHLVHAEFTNHQYQDLVDPHSVVREYVTKSENSIFFEVDGPYKAMILPSSLEEDKLLKKRYAVFNDDGTLAELKGFEVKRRGELKLIKIFQTAIFKVFLEGSTLNECYSAVATVCDQWLDVLFSKGADLPDHELFELISENRSMSKSLDEYGAQKSTSISTAKRLAEFLGDAMVKDKGLACKFIISQKPIGSPVSERAIPVSIFQAEESIKRHYLRKWLKDNSLVDVNIRHILDWSYYIERFGSVIQKLITIPAAMQGVSNPVPRIKHPDWLQKRVSALEDRFKQRKITDLFAKRVDVLEEAVGGMEVDDDGFGGVSEDENSAPVVVGGVEARDMEDAVADGNRDVLRKVGGVRPTVNKALGKRSRDSVAAAPSASAAVAAEVEIPDVLPDPKENYSAYLKVQKLKWRRMRMEKARALTMGIGGVSSRSMLNRPSMSSTESFFLRQTKSILHEPWQILQISATDNAGEFNVWTLIGDAMHTVKLQIPRIMYINSRVAQPEDLGMNGFRMEKRQKTLPRTHVCLNLYELSMSETFYRDHTDVFARLFSHHDVEGVYETQVPLLFRGLMNLGCCASVNASRVQSGRGLEAGFDLSDLKHQSFSKVPYLKDANLKVLYLYHAGKGSKHVYGLFSSASDKVSVYVVDAARNRAAIPNLSRIYAELCAERDSQDGVSSTPYQNSSSQSQSQRAQNVAEGNSAFKYSEDMNISFSVHATDSDALSAINQAVWEYQNSRRGPTMVVIQSPKLPRQLQSDGVSNLKDFPIITIQSHKKDNTLPALGWQTQASRRMMAHFLNFNSILHERIELARYSDIPIGNIEDDFPLFLSDVFFARRLHKADMVLWYSPSDRPDLGGREQDDNQLELDELVNPEINHSGTYSNVCVEIDLFNLAFNTVLQSSHVNEIEGSSDVDGVNGGSNFVDDQFKTANKEQQKSEEHQLTTSSLTTSDENNINFRTFRIIREMVQSWQYQFESRNDKMAEMMLEHLYRWLTSSASRMHDPALFNMIHRLMRKVFLQLVGEFKQLGSQVVYCSFEKLVLSTCKTTLKHAIHYAQYVIESICKKPIFKHIEIAATRFWDHLIWMDRHNFGGVSCNNPQEVIEGRNVSDVVDGESMTIDMCWNIKDYLPPILHKDFEEIVGQYIYEVHREKAARRARLLAGPAPVVVDGDDPDTQAKATGTAVDLTVFLQELVGVHMKRKMFTLIPTVERRVCPNTAPDHQFPDLPGSHLDFKNPALEFVKTLVAVLELDKSIERNVRVLKRDSLTLLGIKEFSEEAVFVNPCEPFRLPQVICEYCNLTRDMDLTRDRDLLPIQEVVEDAEVQEAENESESEASDSYDDEDDEYHGKQKMQAAPKVSRTRIEIAPRPWLCSSCGTEYDRSSIEQRLVNLVSKRILVWQLQDLKCKLCKNIRARNLDDQCECSGEYATTLSRSEFLRKLKVFANIARFYDMEMLREIVEWVLNVV